MLEEKIYADYLSALKNRDKHQIEFLSFIRSELKNMAIQLRKDKLTDEEVISVLHKQKKRLEEVKETISLSGKEEFMDKIEKELELIYRYIPKPLSEEELLEIIDKKISELQALSLKDMGRVMKEVLAEVGVRADSKKVADLVKNKLSMLERGGI